MSSANEPGARGVRGPHSQARRGFLHLLMLVVVTCWSANIVAGKAAVAGFGAVALAQLRVFGAALLFAFLFITWSKRPRLRLDRREWVFFVVMALSGVTLNQLFFIGGLARSSVAHTGLIVALGPVMVLALASLMRLEALTALKLAGMVVSFGGVGLLTLSRGARANGAHWTGDLIQLAGTAVFSYYIILMKEITARFDALTLNVLTFGLGTLLMLPFSARALWAADWSRIGRTACWGLAFMIVFGTVVPYLLFAHALTGLTASRVAAFNYLQPAIAIALGMWMLSERLTLQTMAGGGLILLGVYFTERERGEEKILSSGRGGELKLWM